MGIGLDGFYGPFGLSIWFFVTKTCISQGFGQGPRCFLVGFPWEPVNRLLAAQQGMQE